MLRYVTKKQYWDILDSGIMRPVKPTARWHLKDIQDAVAFSHLHLLKGNAIAEIGAGHSRILPALVKQNRCHAVDEYKGADGGPSTLPDIPGVQFVHAKLGADSSSLPNGSFDVVFSVSVLEHVGNANVTAFFEDCWRILKPGGLMIHLVDAYLETVMLPDNPLVARMKLYRQPLESSHFLPTGQMELETIESLAFQSSYASNPDDTMNVWNAAAPKLRELRERAQSCTIELVYRKAKESERGL